MTAISAVRDVLTVGDDRTPFDYIWCDGCLYVYQFVGVCPNYRAMFTKYTATIQQLDANVNRYNTAIINTPQNFNYSIDIPTGATVVVGGPSVGYRATFIANESFAISSRGVNAVCETPNMQLTIPMLVNHCVGIYPKELLGHNYLKKQIREFANNALRRLTGAFILITCGVIMISSYYNVIMIFMGK
ncbi:hypothetical protein F-S17_0029 [Faustovirus]|nr:hypothetical protein F-S17_0029 [Faustovirus]